MKIKLWGEKTSCHNSFCKREPEVGTLAGCFSGAVDEEVTNE